MRVLYIGQYGAGSTSRMRGESLQRLLGTASFEVIDIDEPIYRTNRLFRSFGWRYKSGPLIGNIEAYIKGRMNGNYDLVWIDKGIFLGAGLVSAMKADIKVHYTPDTAIIFNQSRLFFESIPLYDWCITTKSFEIEAFRKKGARKVLFCTQGYDTNVHHPYHAFHEKEGIVFVGHCEEEREYILAKLLEKKLKVKLAGPNWEKFARKYRTDNYLSYIGKGVYGNEYGSLLSGGQLGLGLLSKWFPERHTTRTLEIPACGTALASERNEDTLAIFSEEEALFYSDPQELIEKAEFALRDPIYLEKLTQNGFERVTKGEFEYLSILKNLLVQMKVVDAE
jgi:spore maturation protein CgeB